MIHIGRGRIRSRDEYEEDPDDPPYEEDEESYDGDSEQDEQLPERGRARGRRQQGPRGRRGHAPVGRGIDQPQAADMSNMTEDQEIAIRDSFNLMSEVERRSYKRARGPIRIEGQPIRKLSRDHVQGPKDRNVVWRNIPPQGAAPIVRPDADEAIPGKDII